MEIANNIYFSSDLLLAAEGVKQTKKDREKESVRDREGDEKKNQPLGHILLICDPTPLIRSVKHAAILKRKALGYNRRLAIITRERETYHIYISKESTRHRFTTRADALHIRIRY